LLDIFLKHALNKKIFKLDKIAKFLNFLVFLFDKKQKNGEKTPRIFS